MCSDINRAICLYKLPRVLLGDEHEADTHYMFIRVCMCLVKYYVMSATAF